MISFATLVVLARIVGAVLGCGAAAVMAGLPLSLRFGGLAISATSWRRLAAQSMVLLLTAEVLDIPQNRRTQGRALALLLGVFISLSLVSSPTRVGDGFEYMAMALALADISPPALSQEQLGTQSRAFAQMAGFQGDPGLRMPALSGADGRQDFPHFWFYPLLASPWVAAARLVGVHPNAGFTALNCGLLLLASFALLRQSGPTLAVLIAVSPVLWWIDKAHTEVFTYSLLTIAIVALRETPWWSLICLGMASTQNPPFALAFVVAAVAAGCSSLRSDRRLWLAGTAGGLLCLLHPLYYLWHLGRLSPLAEATTPNMPTLAALVTPLWDPSLGILVHFPGLGLLLVVGLWCVVRDPTHRLPARELAAAVAMAVVFLLAFTQTGNVNSAGTPHPSRYGLWLVPLTIPALAWTWESLARRQLLWVGTLIVAASGLYSVYAYQPKWPEQYLNPTRLAGWLWTRWPTLSNPLPEVFVERISGVDGQHTLPVATSGCDKILLAADERGNTAWPLPCRPEPLPADCRKPAALCYASRTSSGYVFTRAPRQAGFTYELATLWTWFGDGEGTGHDVFSRAGSVPMSIVRADKPASLLAPWESSRMRRTYALRGEGVLLAWFEPVDQTAASVSIALPSAGTITLVDPVTNLELASINAAAGQRVLASLPDIPATALVARFR